MKNNALSQNFLPFPQPAPTYYAADFFVDKCNDEAYDLLVNGRIAGLPRKTLWLIGERSSGKTHLANIFLERRNAINLSHKKDPFDYLTQAACDSDIGGVVCDNIEQFADVDLFHIINWAHEKGLPLLLTSCDKISPLLPDLKTRLRALYCCHINEPSEDLICTIIYKHFSDAQIIPDCRTIAAVNTIAAGKGFGFLSDILKLISDSINREKCKLNGRNIDKILKNVKL